MQTKLLQWLRIIRMVVADVGTGTARGARVTTMTSTRTRARSILDKEKYFPLSAVVIVLL